MSLALDILLRRGEAGPGKIVGFTVHSVFSIEEVLCCGLPFLFFKVGDLSVLRWLLLKEMKCWSNYLICFVTLADLGPNRVEKLLTGAMSRRGLRHLSIDRAGHVCDHNSPVLVLITVLHP